MFLHPHWPKISSMQVTLTLWCRGRSGAVADDPMEPFCELWALIRLSYWMLPPVSRVCVNYYFNFMLADQHCHIVPFKGNSYFGGLLASLYFWLSASQDIRGTYPFPQTVPHAVLTLPRGGSQTHFPGGSMPLPCWQKPSHWEQRQGPAQSYRQGSSVCRPSERFT